MTLRMEVLFMTISLVQMSCESNEKQDSSDVMKDGRFRHICFVSSQLQVWFLICHIIEHVVEKLSLYLDRWILESLSNRDHELQLSWASVTGNVIVSSTQTHTAVDWALYAMLTYTHSMTLTGRISR